MAPLAEALKFITDALVTIREFISTLTNPLYQTLKRRAVHIVKTLGLLLTLGFAGASLYYAKAAADDAHCQLEIQKKQYCDTATDEMKQKYPCEEILARGADWLSDISCCCGGPDWLYWQLIFALPAPYYQHYGLTYCQGNLFGGEPWWLGWGKPYDVRFRPILWRFPDAYMVAGFLTRPVGMVTVAAVYAALVWLNVGKLRAKRSLQVWLVCGLVGLTALSFWLMAAEAEQLVEHWQRVNKWRFKPMSMGIPLSSGGSEVLAIPARPIWRSFKNWLLPWLRDLQYGVLSAFDYEKPTYRWGLGGPTIGSGLEETSVMSEFFMYFVEPVLVLIAFAW